MTIVHAATDGAGNLNILKLWGENFRELHERDAGGQIAPSPFRSLTEIAPFWTGSGNEKAAVVGPVGTLTTCGYGVWPAWTQTIQAKTSPVPRKEQQQQQQDTTTPPTGTPFLRTTPALCSTGSCSYRAPTLLPYRRNVQLSPYHPGHRHSRSATLSTRCFGGA
ncbi:hypothetical protein GJ744_002615 [Endocarpon pusillum]|uniref:Uncharacterized protein n=1 Tax=Endocarpon pusillum TaxID=364733 RepID=A0A8H7ABR5_9EURO|nr:hypothetical protein GJ744_002615 [Endocarpon pusillum]